MTNPSSQIKGKKIPIKIQLSINQNLEDASVLELKK